MDPTRSFRLRSGMAVVLALSVMFYIGVAARSEFVRESWSTPATLGVELTAAAGTAAVLAGLYGALLAKPAATRRWSRVATAIALLTLVGYGFGFLYGWWWRD